MGHSDQSSSDHGQAGSGSVRPVQPGEGHGGGGGGHQREAVAEDHQGTGAPVLHHLHGIHS